MISFSLLVCTVNRPELLERCLRSLAAQEYCGRKQIIVVDQSDAVSGEVANSPLVDEYIHLDRKGLSNARNEGLSVATCDYVCLIDDDATYPPDYLTNVSEAIENSHADVVCGPIFDPNAKRYALRGMERGKDIRVNFWNALSYGMSAATTFRNLGNSRLFDTAFGVGSTWGAGEETDMIWRFLDNRGIVLYSSKCRVFHPVKPKADLSVSRARNYAEGFGALFAKRYSVYGDRRAVLYFLYSMTRNIAGLLLYTVRRDSCMKDVQRASFLGKKDGFKQFLGSKHRP